MAFASVLGHERVKELLARALRDGRLPPAVLLAGPEGVGKKTLALAAARALLCRERDGDACERCASCSRALRGLHPDLRLVEAESSAIKIEQVRGVVREIAGRPFEGRARAFVIDDAHLMTEQACNALLKSLEEPPASSHVFLVSASPQTLLPTIRSRCQTLRLGPLPLRLLSTHLEATGLAPGEARLRATMAAGSLRAALDFDSEEFRSLRDGLLSLLEGLERMGPLERLQAAERLEQVDDPALALTALRSLLRDLVALRAGASSGRVLNVDVGSRLDALARGRLGERASEMAEVVGETRAAFRANANKLLSMDRLMDRLAP